MSDSNGSRWSERKAATRRRAALKAGLPFGLAMGVLGGAFATVLAGWHVGVPVGLVVMLVTGTIFGVSLTTICGAIADKATEGMGPDALDVNQTRVIEVDGDVPSVLRRVASAMGALPRAKSTDVNELEGTVRTTVGMTWKSFGEFVEARVESQSPNSCRVQVKSSPRLSTTVFDYGKNAVNVSSVIAELE